jgi:LuxR family maltose regulon positive regulatory protein
VNALLLQTKVIPPQAHLAMLPRPHLLARLNYNLINPGGFTRKLTLICAPAGYGKTSLAVDWLRHQEAPFAWLSLDDGDNDPARFLGYLISALRRVQAEIGASALAMLAVPGPPPVESVLMALVNELTAARQPLIMVLDEYNTIQATPIHQMVAFLLERQPDYLHQVIISRADPPLPMHRLRARRQMLEIRQDDLRFSSEESAAFLKEVMGVRLAQGDIEALTVRTEGWVAGLQLAALSLRSHPDTHAFVQSFTGSNRYVLDYLFEEAFRQQPAEVRAFLIKTSLLKRLTASLCNAVTGSDDAQIQLERLEKANLFITPLDPERQWYRYHSLFADLLHHLLHLSGDPPEAELHRRASRWFWENGVPAEAVQHALEALDWELAGAIIQDSSDSLLKRGEGATLLSWLSKLPMEFLSSQSRLYLTYAWVLMLAGHFDTAQPVLGQMEQAIQGPPALIGEIAAAQAYLAQTLGDGKRLIEMSHKALALLPEDDLTKRGLVALNLGIAYWHLGRLAEAEQALEDANLAARKTGNTYGEMMARILQGRTFAVRGKLRQAAASLEAVAQEAGKVYALPLVYLDLGALHYEWNDLNTAARYLTQGLEASQRGANVEFETAAWMLLARLQLIQGDLPGATYALEQARRLEQTSTLPSRALARIHDLQVQQALWLGDLDTARQLAAQLVPDSDAHPFYRTLGLTPARLLIAQGQRGEALEQLTATAEAALRNDWGYGLMATRVLQAIAAESGETALEFLGDALTRGQAEGFIRTFVDAGEPLVPLLQDAARHGLAPEYCGRILAAFGGKNQAAPATPGLVEPLSERELEVLRLVAAGLSNRQIASRLAISPSTAKSHVHNICGKLGASNRAHALTLARELKLL